MLYCSQTSDEVIVTEFVGQVLNGTRHNEGGDCVCCRRHSPMTSLGGWEGA